MRIVEVIYFTHELDMLEAHLEEHAGFVDKFVIKESPCLWTGPEKPLYYDQNRDRFYRFNIEHMIIPADEFNLTIPAVFPEEEFKKWFDVRRNNRGISRTYRWDDIRDGADWVFSMDCDEIIDSRRVQPLLDILVKRDFEHVAVKLKQSQFWVNVRDKDLTLWRIFRGDVPYRPQIRGFPRGTTDEYIGWHFTNCYDPEGIRLKALGITTHYGYKGIKTVPLAEEIEASLNDGLDPFSTRWTGGRLVSEDPRGLRLCTHKIRSGREGVPRFMREHPEKFPWYPTNEK